MATIGKSDLRVYESLTNVRILGFAPEKDDDGQEVDGRGSANYLCDAYGLRGDSQDADEAGILWTDYDCGASDGWAFAVLISTDEVEALRTAATEAGYEILGVREIDEPCHYGDGSGTCTILKHPDGWVVVS